MASYAIPVTSTTQIVEEVDDQPPYPDNEANDNLHISLDIKAKGVGYTKISYQALHCSWIHQEARYKKTTFCTVSTSVINQILNRNL